ncbi:MAG: glycosyltransferase [Candidatus Competibacteraceae bacterium]|nr:glycosyltransferase [Candidatus Competibacteraceae bacterium]
MQAIKIIYENHGAGIHTADTLSMICQGLELAGYRADIEKELAPGHLNILLENFTDEFTERVLKLADTGTDFIIVATEFLTGNTFNDFRESSFGLPRDVHYDNLAYWVKRHHNFQRLSERALAVWHLSEHQVPVYRQALPGCRVEYLPHGYIAAFRRVVMRPDADRDIDFLFTGSLTPYRRRILSALEKQGYRVHAAPAMTAHFHREQLLARTRIALNLRQHAQWLHPSNSRFHYHLNNASLLLTERCHYSCDLDAYVEHSSDIVNEAIMSLSCGHFSERAESALARFAKARPMGHLMASLMETSLTAEKLAQLGIQSSNKPVVAPKHEHIESQHVVFSDEKKPKALVCLSVKPLWEDHLLSSLAEVFNVHKIIYLTELIKKLDHIDHLSKFINDFVDHEGISFIFLGIERLHKQHTNFYQHFRKFYSEIQCRKIYALLFDDVVFRKENLDFLENGPFEMVLTACPLSALKYQECNIPALFFPLEGHEKWYFYENNNRDIDILFYGDLRKGKRKEYLSKIRQAGFSITYVGGQTRSLSIMELCEYLRRSKIVLNFSESFNTSGATYYQFKGRILEAAFCGALCISEKNPPASLLFGNHLPQFSTPEECINLIDLLLKDHILYEQVRIAFVSRSELYRPAKIIKNIFQFNPSKIMGNDPIDTDSSVGINPFLSVNPAPFALSSDRPLISSATQASNSSALPTIPVIIPAYRKPEQLRQCLACLEQQTQPVDVFVRDNNEDNIYFTAAANEGIRRFLATDCPAILLLNQDMYLAADAVERLWRFMERHPRCGIAGPIEMIKGHPQNLAKGGGLESFPWGRHRVAPVDALRYDERLHWINGVCLLLRREMIEEIGLLDRNLKFICSDVDYCLTARERGWQVWRVGDALGEHEPGGASTGLGDNPELEFIKIKDVLFFAKKWLTGDLYRKLAYDGQALTPEVIAAGIRRLRGESS